MCSSISGDTVINAFCVACTAWILLCACRFLSVIQMRPSGPKTTTWASNEVINSELFSAALSPQRTQSTEQEKFSSLAQCRWSFHHFLLYFLLIPTKKKRYQFTMPSTLKRKMGRTRISNFNGEFLYMQFFSSVTNALICQMGGRRNKDKIIITKKKLLVWFPKNECSSNSSVFWWHEVEDTYFSLLAHILISKRQERIMNCLLLLLLNRSKIKWDQF